MLRDGNRHSILIARFICRGVAWGVNAAPCLLKVRKALARTEMFLLSLLRGSACGSLEKHD